MKKTDAEILEALRQNFELMIEIFGPGVCLEFACTKDGKRQVQVCCSHCGQRNRLGERVRGAICGSCKSPLSTVQMVN